MAIWPRVLMLRHGETVWNAEHRMQGGLDSPLTPRGRAQAARQHAILATLDLGGFDAFCSPQGRAFATAAIALDHHVSEIRTDDRLREVRVGDWEGQRRADLADLRAMTEAGNDPLLAYDRAPGGEGFAALHARCLSFLRDRTGPTIIVAHGITSRMMRTILLGRGMEALGEMGGGQGIVWDVENGRQNLLE